MTYTLTLKRQNSIGFSLCWKIVLMFSNVKGINEVFQPNKIVKHMEWISIKQRMPNDGGNYLVTDGEFVWIAFHWKPVSLNWQAYHEQDFYKSEKVTHWMPLPPVPSKVEKFHLSNVSGSLHTEFLVGKNFCPICSPGIYANSRVQHHAPREKCIECGHVQEYHIVNPTQ